MLKDLELKYKAGMTVVLNGHLRRFIFSRGEKCRDLFDISNVDKDGFHY